MTISKRRVPHDILRALDATELPYDFEMGTRHIKIRLSGHFVGILPKGSSCKSESYGKNWAVKNSVAQIRRAARGIKEVA